MQHSSFKLAFLSPAFIGGAVPKREDQNGPLAELRAPSILGQLRSWHRLLGKQASEARIFGSVAGDSRTAAGFSVRVLDPPEQVKAATTPKSIGLDRSYFLYAQEMDNGANYRAALPEGATFSLILINRRLSPADWDQLLSTATAFAWLGTLGNRSRRGFGALTIREINGKPTSLPDPASLLPPETACAFPENFKPRDTFASFATEAGNWLRDARTSLKDSGKRKSDYFGSIAEKGTSRLASPILLRPWRKDGKFHLLLVGPKHLLSEISRPHYPEDHPPTEPESDDPVAALLAPPFEFSSITKYKAQVQEWQNSGRPDLVTRFVALTQEPKYGGLRQQAWYPPSI